MIEICDAKRNCCTITNLVNLFSGGKHKGGTKEVFTGVSLHECSTVRNQTSPDITEPHQTLLSYTGPIKVNLTHYGSSNAWFIDWAKVSVEQHVFTCPLARWLDTPDASGKASGPSYRKVLCSPGGQLLNSVELTVIH